MPATIHQLNVSDGGVPKFPVETAEVTTTGLAGDPQRDTRFHGGPERALCLFALENIERLQAEGHPVKPGSTGENITLSGVDWPSLVPGARLRLGSEVEIEISSFTTPCKNLEPFFSDGDFNRLNVKRNPANSRVYARILTTGTIRTGDPVEVRPAVP